MQAVRNATQFIYVENQYFRWEAFADQVKKVAQRQVAWGRDPGKHGPIHLFVVTNSTDEAIGLGAGTTYDMLASLGRADTMPGVARVERGDALRAELSEAKRQETIANTQMRNGGGAQAEAAAREAHAGQQKLRQQLHDNEQSHIVPMTIPGLKIHVCTLVAPDSPADNWMPVYVHSKIMIIDDVFLTHGSANINRRSMEVDSELNICHEHMGVTQPLRRRLWGIHTGEMGAQDNPADAFDQWERIIKRNADNQIKGLAPCASLAGFMRTSTSRLRLDCPMTKPAVILLALLLCACSHKDSEMPSSADMKAVRDNLAFTCIHEADQLPTLEMEANRLFVYGRYLEKSGGPKDFNAIARYYRIAAAYGHYKANHNLQLLVSEGSASSPDPEKETIDLAEQLIKAGIPGGYYDMGHYLELGFGVKRDEDKARRYFRKAADLGSPEAQAYVGNLLAPRDKAPAIARQMRQCAADQGYGDAANTLGIDLQTDRLFSEAVNAFQKGVQSGNGLSALALEGGFKGPLSTDRLNYLALPQDPERAKRYRAIQLFLRANEGRNPKIPDIDKIVPLPPAQLPPWDGTFQWEKEQAAVVAPEKPSDELIDRMAKAKHLDPETGLPLPNGSSKSSEATEPSSKVPAANIAGRVPIGTVAYSGDVCPEDGVWCASLANRQSNGAERRFAKGETLPTLIVQAPRPSSLLGRWRERREYPERVVWQLTAYPEQA